MFDDQGLYYLEKYIIFSLNQYENKERICKIY